MRKLSIFSFAFSASAALFVYLGCPENLLWYCGGLFALALTLFCIFRKKRTIRVAALILIGLCAGLFYCRGYEQLRLRPAKQLAGTTQELTIEVLEEPTKSTYGYKVTGQLGKKLHRTRVLLYVDDELDVSLGDQINVTAELRDSLKSSDGEVFLYYQTKDISLVCIARSEPFISRHNTLPLRLWPAKLSLAIRNASGKLFDREARGFMQALMTGDRGDLSDQQQGDLSRSGISHVIAISGMHVSILLGAVYLLCVRNKRLTALIGIPLVLVFAAMVGFSPSVTRAAIMQIIFLLAPLLRRENDLPTTLGASLLVNLLINPWAISSLSLQLSYTSLIGILLFGSRIYQWIKPRKTETSDSLPRKIFGRIWGYIALCASTTLSAMIFTTPLLALSFGSVPILSLLTNLLILWAISICFTVGYLAVLVSLFWSFGGHLIALPINLLVRYILRAAELVSSVPYAALSVKNPFVLYWLGFAYCALLVHLLLRKRRKKGIFAVVLAASLLLCVGLTVLQKSPDAELTAVDVGQGQCLILRSGEWCAVFDCGGSDGFDCGEAAAEYLENQGQLSIDCLIVSHYDKDHVCGIEQLLHRSRVKQLYLPSVRDDTGWRAELESLAAQYEIPVQYVLSDVSLQLPTGKVCITPPMLEDDSNAASLGVIFRTEKLSVLATGDMDTEAEACLTRRYNVTNMDVLIAGHHGSKYSTGETLLKNVKPEAVIISVGKNSYGHPARRILERIEDIGAVVYRTDKDGTITIKR